MTFDSTAGGSTTGLLAGPRGRQACVEVARLVDPQLLPPRETADRMGSRLLIEQLNSVDVAAVASLEDPLVLLEALGASVDSARYWQEPDEQDAVLADAHVRAAFEPVARALESAPAARWWWSGAALARQAVVRWLEPGRARAAEPQLTRSAQRLRRWRDDTRDDEARAARDRPADPAAPFSGYWWSTPTFADLVTTTRRLGRLPAVQLELVEDSMGWERARVASIEIRTGVRVFEIAAASDWSELVSRYPLDVDRSRRHDWYRATGGLGPWQIPDWVEVSRDYDAVHLSVAGYLAAAGRVLRTEAGWTVLAGFDPDLTYWLTDSLTLTETPATWVRREADDLDHEWIRETLT